jgi:hypothetical protein
MSQLPGISISQTNGVICSSSCALGVYSLVEARSVVAWETVEGV